jgi:multidrug efflux system membrane fusion protein
VSAAKLNLDYSRITSPIDGVAGLRQADPGNVVRSTDSAGLVVVTQLDPIAVLFTLPEDDLTAIREAMSSGALDVEARSRDGDKVLGAGKLSVIDNEINQTTATIRLKAVFDNPDRLLWPNQFVKARLKLKVRENAVVVPAVVIQRGPQGAFAYVAANSVATMRPVTVDAMEGDLAIVGKGLQPGEQVVVEGQAQIRPGSRVSAKLATSQSASSASARAGGAAP